MGSVVVCKEGVHFDKPRHSWATTCPSWNGPQVIFPHMQVTQLKNFESSGTLVSPSTRPFLIICCRVSFPGWVSCLWTRSKEGGMTRAASALTEVLGIGESLVFKK